MEGDTEFGSVTLELSSAGCQHGLSHLLCLHCFLFSVITHAFFWKVCLLVFFELNMASSSSAVLDFLLMWSGCVSISSPIFPAEGGEMAFLGRSLWSSASSVERKCPSSPHAQATHWWGQWLGLREIRRAGIIVHLCEWGWGTFWQVDIAAWATSPCRGPGWSQSEVSSPRGRSLLGPLHSWAHYDLRSVHWVQSLT